MLYCDRDDATLKPTPLTELRFTEGVDPAAPQRIWLRHQSVALGYWRRSEAQQDGFAHGWYSPGDLFLRRADGRLEFVGRNDDMLKIAGQWVSTLWVEQALAGACGDALQQVAAVGVTSVDGLTALAVLAVATPDMADVAAQRMQESIASCMRCAATSAMSGVAPASTASAVRPSTLVTPTAATCCSASPQAPASACSTHNVLTHWPAIFSMSSLRPANSRRPSARRRNRSPGEYQPCANPSCWASLRRQ